MLPQSAVRAHDTHRDVPIETSENGAKSVGFVRLNSVRLRRSSSNADTFQRILTREQFESRDSALIGLFGDRENN